jgi:ABC-2 type transport system permease protein
MSAFTRIAAVARKEFLQLARDRLTFGLIIGIPILLITLFGYAINFDVRHLKGAVLDEARSSASREFIAELEASQVLDVTQHVQSSREIDALMRDSTVVLAVAIPADFERRLIDGQIDGNRPAAQILVDGSQPSLENVANALKQLPVFQRHGADLLAPQRFEVRVMYNPERRTAVQIVPALVGTILHMTMVVFTAGAIVRERERGNLELLITTPVSPAELMAGKLIPYILIGLIQTTVIVAVGNALFDVPINGRLIDLYLAALIYIAATLTLGLLISTVAQTQFQAFQMAFATMLPSVLLSGLMFPFDGMPRAARWIAQALPLTHFNVMVRGIALRGAALTDLSPQIWKLTIFFVIALGAARLRFRKRLD